jgi:Ni/Co efflux regulator RcnB
MKNILLASVIALATVSAAIAPTQAETMIVKTNDHDHMHMKKHCRTKLVTHWRHHHKVTETVKVCN